MTLIPKRPMMAARVTLRRSTMSGLVAAAAAGGILCGATVPADAGCKYPQATKRDTLARNNGPSFPRSFLLTTGNANILAIGTDAPNFDISLSVAIKNKERCNRPTKGDNWIMCSVSVGAADLDSSRVAEALLSLHNNDNREVGYVLVCIDQETTRSFGPAAITHPKAKTQTK